MSSLRQIKRKLKTVRSTLAVTKAMKVIASTRLAKAQVRILNSRPFALRMQEMMESIDAEFETRTKCEEDSHNPFFCGHKSDNALLVLVSADKGLCGAFNHNIINFATDFIKQNKSQDIKIIAVGKKRIRLSKEVWLPGL